MGINVEELMEIHKYCSENKESLSILTQTNLIKVLTEKFGIKLGFSRIKYIERNILDVSTRSVGRLNKGGNRSLTNRAKIVAQEVRSLFLQLNSDLVNQGLKPVPFQFSDEFNQIVRGD